jgi:hypothetical protein
MTAVGSGELNWAPNGGTGASSGSASGSGVAAAASSAGGSSPGVSSPAACSPASSSSPASASRSRSSAGSAAAGALPSGSAAGSSPRRPRWWLSSFWSATRGSPPVWCSRAPIAEDWRPRRSTGLGGSAPAPGAAAGSTREVCGPVPGRGLPRPGPGGAVSGGAGVRHVWQPCRATACGPRTHRSDRGGLPLAAGALRRGPDRAGRPRRRCRRAGPAPHARPEGATAGAGRRRRPARPTRRRVERRASPAGRPCAVWHNLPPRPPTRRPRRPARRRPGGRSWCASRR